MHLCKSFLFMYMILKIKTISYIFKTILQEVIDYFKLRIIWSFMALSVLLMSFLSIRENRIVDLVLNYVVEKTFSIFPPQIVFLAFFPAKSGKLGPSSDLSFTNKLITYIICTNLRQFLVIKNKQCHREMKI